MDLLDLLRQALKNPFSLQSFYVIFVNIFIILVAGIFLVTFFEQFYGK